MDLSTFIVADFCLIDDRLKGRRFRGRGPSPKLSDSEVLTIEVVGEFLGIVTDKDIYLFFCRRYTRLSVAPANAHELSVLLEIAEMSSGLLVEDRNYHSPNTKEELVRMVIELLAPYSSKKRDPNPQRSAFVRLLHYRIDTVFSHLTGRYSIKCVWARDPWHLAIRLVRKGLSHTVAFLLNHQVGNPPLQLSKLLI